MEDVEILAGDRPGTYLLRMGGLDQSHVDLLDPTRIEFDYVRRLADVLDVHAPPGHPVRVVHVGGGAMTLARYVAAARPRSAQVVLEPAEQVTELVRREIPLPRQSGIKVRAVDGSTGVHTLRDGHAGLVVLDAFAGGRVPADLVTVEFFADVARVLEDEGLFLLNLTDRAPFAWTRRVLAGLRPVFPAVCLSAEPATVRGRRTGNLVVVASRRTVPLEALRAAAASSSAPYRVLDAGQVRDGFGGGAPFTAGVGIGTKP